MMADPTPATTEDDARVVAALEEYVAALESGGRPNRPDFLARHAPIAPILADCLDGVEWLRSALPRLVPPPTPRG